QDSKRPFRVVSRGQMIDVLGTSFNVAAREKEMMTTLVDGAVRVSLSEYDIPKHKSRQSVLLSPGFQARLSDRGLQVKAADIESVMAWRNGLFNFNDKSLEEVIQQLVLWYDIEVVYKGKVPAIEFYGEIRRDRPLSEALYMLEKSGVRFHMERDKRLVVYE